ncbi:MAG: hypothetical protein LBK62_00275 [Treponema sp.]|jgi:hypothetical protein|nr:hypothetical protein [Treponema sp.]
MIATPVRDCLQFKFGIVPLCAAAKLDLQLKVKEGRKKVPNFQERIAKAAQVLSYLNENFFDCEPLVRFDLAVNNFPQWVRLSALRSFREGFYNAVAREIFCRSLTFYRKL